jgi:hypothetical protein
MTGLPFATRVLSAACLLCKSCIFMSMSLKYEYTRARRPGDLLHSGGLLGLEHVCCSVIIWFFGSDLLGLEKACRSIITCLFGLMSSTYHT